jgi:starvation-inducible DNA-binding protein
MKTKLHETQNDLPEKSRQETVAMLNQQLADVLDLGLKAKQAHWNVKGPHFIGLHELFDKVAEVLAEFTDEIAERAVELGGVALGTIQIVNKSSRLPAYPLDAYSGKSHVAALSRALAAFGKTTRSAIDSAARMAMPTQQICSPKFHAAWTSCCGWLKRMPRQPSNDPAGEPEMLRCPRMSENAATGIGSRTAPTTCRRPFGASVPIIASQSRGTFTVLIRRSKLPASFLIAVESLLDAT